MEKGVIIDAYDLKLKKEVFYYGKLGMSREEIKKWESDIIDQIMADDNLNSLYSYWDNLNLDHSRLLFLS